MPPFFYILNEMEYWFAVTIEGTLKATNDQGCVVNSRCDAKHSQLLHTSNVSCSDQHSFLNAVCHNYLLDVDNAHTIFLDLSSYVLFFSVKGFLVSPLSLDFPSFIRADVVETEEKWQS